MSRVPRSHPVPSGCCNFPTAGQLRFFSKPLGENQPDTGCKVEDNVGRYWFWGLKFRGEGAVEFQGSRFRALCLSCFFVNF